MEWLIPPSLDETLKTVKILLDKESSSRLQVLILVPTKHVYLSIKISSPEEIIDRNVDRNYIDMLNGYMIFRIDFYDAFNVASLYEHFRANSGSISEPSLLWKIFPSEITDEYYRVFENYKKLKPKPFNFVLYNYPDGSNNNEPEAKNAAVTLSGINNYITEENESRISGTIGNSAVGMDNSFPLSNEQIVPNEHIYDLLHMQYMNNSLHNGFSENWNTLSVAMVESPEEQIRVTGNIMDPNNVDVSSYFSDDYYNSLSQLSEISNSSPNQPMMDDQFGF